MERANSKCDLIPYDYKNGCDVLDYHSLVKAIDTVDAIIHLAALRGVPESFNEALNYTEVNVLGSVNVLEASKGKRVVLASSSSVAHNQSPYAASKLSMEAFAKVYHQQGSPCVCLRYFNVFGPGQPSDKTGGVIPRFITALLEGRPVTIYDGGHQCRDFTYVDNVVQATLKALIVPNLPSSGPYDVGMGEPVSVLKLLRTLEGIMKVKAKINFEPERPGDVRSSCAAPIETCQTFGWEPDVGFEEGLRRTVRWFKEQYAHARSR